MYLKQHPTDISKQKKIYMLLFQDMVLINYQRPSMLMLMLIKKLPKNKSLIWQLNILNLVSKMQIPMTLCWVQLLATLIIIPNYLNQQIQSLIISDQISLN